MISCLLYVISQWYYAFTNKSLFKYPEGLGYAMIPEIVFEIMLCCLLHILKGEF